MSKLLSPAQAADYLCLSEKTLEAMRLKGRGPIYVKVSTRRVAYRLEDLDAWIESRLYRSTSEYGRHPNAASKRTPAAAAADAPTPNS